MRVVALLLVLLCSCDTRRVVDAAALQLVGAGDFLGSWRGAVLPESVPNATRWWPYDEAVLTIFAGNPPRWQLDYHGLTWVGNAYIRAPDRIDDTIDFAHGVIELAESDLEIEAYWSRLGDRLFINGRAEANGMPFTIALEHGP